MFQRRNVTRNHICNQAMAIPKFSLRIKLICDRSFLQLLVSSIKRAVAFTFDGSTPITRQHHNPLSRLCLERPQLEAFDFGRPSKDVDQSKIASGKKHKDAPVTPHAAQLTVAEVQALKELFSRGPLAHTARVGGVGIQELGRRCQRPGTGVGAADLSRWWWEGDEILSRAVHLYGAGDGCDDAAEEIGKWRAIIELTGIRG